MLRRRQLIAMQTSGLPGAYRRVEYLEGTGGQYIEIDAIEKKRYFDVTIEVLSPNANSDNLFCGYSLYNDNTSWCVIWNASTIVVRRRYNGQRYDASTSTNNVYGRKCRFILNNTAAKIIECDNGAVLAEDNTLLESSFVISSPVTVFRGYSNSSNYIKGVHARMYQYKAYSADGSLEHDLVPCLRKNDGKVGVYDLISKTFYTNAGTGEFIVPT